MFMSGRVTIQINLNYTNQLGALVMVYIIVL